MIYLLDANVLIDANRDYYPLSRVPQFWDWLIRNGERGAIKVPIEVYEEITAGRDDLADWAKNKRTKSSLLLDEEASPEHVAEVIARGYAPDLADDEVDKLGRDPFIISYALVDLAGRTVVTTEVSKPNRRRANRHIPDVCRELGVLTCNTFQLIRRLDFAV